MRYLIITIFLAVFTAVSCSPQQEGSSSQSSAEQAGQDGRRPIDEGEELPGYLDNPEQIVVTTSQDGSEISISANSDTPPPAGFKIGIWSVALVDIHNALSNKQQTVHGKFLEDFEPSEKGFKRSFSSPYPNLFVLSTNNPDQPALSLVSVKGDAEFTFFQEITEKPSKFINPEQIRTEDIESLFIRHADFNGDNCFDTTDIVQFHRECEAYFNSAKPLIFGSKCDLNGDGVSNAEDYDNPESFVVYEQCI